MSTKEVLSTAARMSEILQGGTLPDITAKLGDIVTVAFMTPTGDPTKLFKRDEKGNLIAWRENGVTTYEINEDVDCNMGVPIMLWGLSGVAKSGTLRSVAKRLRLPYEQVWPGTKSPETFDNVPVVLNGVLAAACMLTELTSLNAQRGGVLVVEEGSQASPAIQAAMMPLFLDRKAGQTKAHQLVRFIGTANPPLYASNGFALAAPFSNRMGHAWVDKPSKESLTNFIMNEGLEVSIGMESDHVKLLDGWHENWQNVKGLWSGFIHSAGGEGARHNQPQPGTAQESYAWPSDRSWEMAFRMLATSRCLGMESTLEPLLLEMCVGQAAAKQLITWLVNADLPDTLHALTKGWKVNKTRLDQVIAVYNAMLMYVLNFPAEEKEKQIDAAALLWKRLEVLGKAGLTDLVAMYVIKLIKANLTHSSRKTSNIKEYKGWDELQKNSGPAIEMVGDNPSVLTISKEAVNPTKK